MSAKQPRSVRFRAEREDQWRELEMMVTRCGLRGPSALSADELERLPVLYRAVLSSLSVARQTAMDRRLVGYLESLASRAYLVVYGARTTRISDIRRIVIEDFPRRVRGMGYELGLSTGFFLLGLVVAFVLVTLEPDWFYAFVSPAYSGDRDPSATTELLRKTLYDGGNNLTTFAAFLFTNNARIGMMAFALGFAAGVPTALLLFLNGLILGSFMGLFADRGLLVPLLGWLLPHGIPEITAVILCGAAGFHVGKSLIAPGKRTVRDSLFLAGRRAAVVVGGSVFLFAVAGLIEGYFRQSVQDDGLRFIMATFNALWVFPWLFLAGTPRKSEGMT